MSKKHLQRVVQSYTLSFDDPPKQLNLEQRLNGVEEEQQDVLTNGGNVFTKDTLYIYQPGERLKGKIDLVVNENLKDINLEIIVEGYFVFNSDRIESKRIDIFSVSTILLPGNANRSETLPAGEHIFPFEFMLPLKCPSTISMAPDLRVTYSVKSRLFTGTINQNRDDNSAFVIEKSFIITQRVSPLTCEPFFAKWHVDLERMRLRPTDPLERNLLTKFRGYIEVKRRAFEQGEYISINSEICNYSRNKVIIGVLVKLVMETFYHAVINENLDRKKLVKIVTCTLDNHSLGHKQTRKWRDVRMQVPHFLPASGVNSSQVYSVEYKLVFEVKFQGMEKPISFACIPIIIGVQTPLELKEVNPANLDHVLNDTKRVSSYSGDTARTSQLVQYNPHLGEFGSSNDFYN